jgi:hypothetical protein
MNENERKRHSCIDINENGELPPVQKQGSVKILPPDLPTLALATLRVQPEVTSSLDSSKLHSAVKAEQGRGP